MVNEALTAGILALGACTIGCSIWAALVFRSHHKRDGNSLAGALKWQLWGEATLGFIAFVFSCGAYAGWLEHWSPYFLHALRAIAFSASALTTVHLLNTIRKIRNERS